MYKNCILNFSKRKGMKLIMIEFRNVQKTYDTGVDAVKNANFRIDKGEFCFLVGASGSR